MGTPILSFPSPPEHPELTVAPSAQLSLWLCPPTDSPLVPFLDALATRLNTVHFDPHATLVSDELVPKNLETQDVVARIEAAVQAWSHEHPDLPLSFQDVRQGNKFYQCILAALVPSPALLALHEALLASFFLPVPSPPTYFPHLSLIYDQLLSPEEKDAVIADLKVKRDVELVSGGGLRVAGEPGFRPVEVLLVQTQGPPPDWKVLARVPLVARKEEAAAPPLAKLVMLGGQGAQCDGELCEF